MGVQSWRDITSGIRQQKRVAYYWSISPSASPILEIMVRQFIVKAEVHILWWWPGPLNYWRLFWLHQSRTPPPPEANKTCLLFPVAIFICLSSYVPSFFICPCQVVIKWRMSLGEIYIVLPAQLLSGKFNYIKLVWTLDKSLPHPPIRCNECDRLLSEINFLFCQGTGCGLIEARSGNLGEVTEEIHESPQSRKSFEPSLWRIQVQSATVRLTYLETCSLLDS
jgi:hypothetical protein